MKKLENKVVFITGANSGIGKASALEAAREGATVIVADLASKNHEETIKEIKAIRKGKEADWWDSLSKAQKEDIEAGLSDLENGRKKSFHKVMAKYK